MDPESSSLKTHFTDLVYGIGNPVQLCARLYSIGMISRDTKSAIFTLNEEKQVIRLLESVMDHVEVDSHWFYKFVDVLEKDHGANRLCDRLRSTCGECDNVCLSIYTSID